MIVQPPVKKATYYHSRITDDHKRILKLTIPYSILKNYLVLSNKQGYLLDVRVPTNDFAMDTIQELEALCIQELIKNNAKWFKNSLEEEKIREYFESCIVGDNLRIYASALRSSGVQHETMVNVGEWLQTYRNQIPKQITITIVCDGMFIYPHKFGLRWIVREIKEYQEPEEIVPEVDEIVTFWQEKASQFVEELLSQKKHWLQKIEQLDSRIEKVRRCAAKIHHVPDMDFSQMEKEIDALKESIKVIDEKTFL